MYRMETSHIRRVRTAGGIRRPDFRRFVIGHAVSLIGAGPRPSQALLVLALDPLGGVARARDRGALPAGTPADAVCRADHRPHGQAKLLLITQASLATLSLVLGAVVLFGAIQLWMVFAVALAFGILTAVDNPARLAFVPEMVGPS